MNTNNEEKTQTDSGTMTLTYPATEVEKQAIEFVINAKNKFEKASQLIRYDLKTAKKNFLGIYNQPRTIETNRKKTWMPLTYWLHKIISSKITANENAINVLPGGEDDVNAAPIMESVLKWLMRQLNFTELVRDFRDQLVLYGNAVWKAGWKYYRTYEIFPEITIGRSWYQKVGRKVKKLVNEINKKYKIIERRKGELNLEVVNLLDLWLNPLTKSLADDVVIHRLVVDYSTLKNTPGYKNVEYVKPVKRVKQKSWDSTTTLTYDIQNSVIEGATDIVEVYEAWGKIPAKWIDKNLPDVKVPGVIRIAWTNNADPVLLQIDANPLGVNPFVEAFYEKNDNTWYARGVGQIFNHFQSYINRAWNRMEENERDLLQGIFVRRRNSGARKLVSGAGVIWDVVDPSDVQQLPIQDITMNISKRVSDAMMMVQQVAGVFDINAYMMAGRGVSQMRATSSLIQENIGKERIADLSDRFKQSIERLFRDLIVPLVIRNLEPGTIIKITGQPDDLEKIDKILNTPEREKYDNYRFVKIQDPKDLDGKYDFQVDLDASVPQNKAVRIKQLQDVLAMATQDPNSGINKQEVYKELLQLLGLKGERFYSEQPNQGAIIPQTGGTTPKVGEPQTEAQMLGKILPNVKLPQQ